MSRTNRRLRSHVTPVALLGMAAFTLAACGEDPIETTYYGDVNQCIAASFESVEFDADDCEDAFENAQAEHLRTAPRYDSQSLCAEQHGVDQCTFVEDNDGGGSFTPFIAGYMMGNVSNSSSHSSYYRAKPVYRSGSGSGLFSSGGAKFDVSPNAYGQKVRSYPSYIIPASPSAKPPAVMTRATVTRVGGFGSARASFGG